MLANGFQCLIRIYQNYYYLCVCIKENSEQDALSELK